MISPAPPATPKRISYTPASREVIKGKWPASSKAEPNGTRGFHRVYLFTNLDPPTDGFWWFLGKSFQKPPVGGTGIGSVFGYLAWICFKSPKKIKDVSQI